LMRQTVVPISSKFNYIYGDERIGFEFRRPERDYRLPASASGRRGDLFDLVVRGKTHFARIIQSTSWPIGHRRIHIFAVLSESETSLSRLLPMN
jgi:hypothetical protein